MDYSILDLITYLLIYSFIGWVAEVVIAYVKYHELRNRGFFNMPLTLTTGVVMDVLIVIIPTMTDNYLMQYVAAVAVSAIVTSIPKGFSRRGGHPLKYDEKDNNLLSGDKYGFLSGLLQGLFFLLAVLVLHPLMFILLSFVPDVVKIIFCTLSCALLIYDGAAVTITLRRGRTQEELDELVSRQKESKQKLGERIIGSVWKRITKAYPGVSLDEGAEKPVFAEGICFDKMVWVFVIMAVAGDLFETVFVWLTTGVLMSRASFIYGPISIVWGCGAVILTIVLQRLKDKEDRFIFFAGCVLGGIYEYTCSVISEVFFDTTFWDYSDMPLNFGGRTNLLFCLFWGILSVWWVKWMFPILSRQIEKIPLIAGKTITYVVLAFIILDGIISGAALLRYVDRIDNPEPSNVIEIYIDENYPDEMLENVWPSLELT